jgi:hypothetical protein
MSENDWQRSKLFAATPKVDENGNFVDWQYWPLEYNIKTLVLRAVNPKDLKNGK